MNRVEVIEWIVIMLVIVSWWPRIFLGYGYNHDPMWYHLLTHYVSPLVLIVIVLRRWRRMQEGFHYSEEMLQHQQMGKPGSESGETQSADGRTPSLPFVPPSASEDDDNT
jgi:hypothetical protein